MYTYSLKPVPDPISPMDEVIDLSRDEAREFFLKEESYCEFDTPVYFDFEPLINSVWEILSGAELHSFYPQVDSPAGEPNAIRPNRCEDVNFTILQNKDGRFAWRPFELIHPVLYVELVKHLTSEGDWNLVQDRLSDFQNIPNIEARGIPVRKSEEDKSDTAATVKKWWRSVELASVELALEYDYLFHTDISDCYGSIYTHSIPWALHTKEVAKERRDDDGLVGNRLDGMLQKMSHGQTNGIPQGSRLMDFIAEVVLGYADLKLFRELKRQEITDYKILRYRDDYRIFTNNPQEGEKILKHLTEVLLDLNMELNPDKTYSSDDVVRSSIKDDKMEWLLSKQKKRSLHKHLLIIQNFSKEFPNSGSLLKALDGFFDRIKNNSKTIERPKVLISIITDIAYRNPRVYHYFAAVLSELLYRLDNTQERRDIISQVRKKFSKLPNTNHLSMWLQRITLCSEIDVEYDEKICLKVEDPATEIWNSEWLSGSLEEAVVGASVVDEDKIEEMSPKIQSDEVKLFSSRYPA